MNCVNYHNRRSNGKKGSWRLYSTEWLKSLESTNFLGHSVVFFQITKNLANQCYCTISALIVTFSILGVLTFLAVPGAFFGYRRYIQSQSGDRVPFFDNSTFETTSHRDLDFTSSVGRSSIASYSGRRSGKNVTFEMTTRKSNVKSDWNAI